MTRECLTHTTWGLSSQDKYYTRKHLITLLYGAVAPIPDDTNYEQINTYSNKDIVLLLNGKYLDKSPNTLPSLEDLRKAISTSRYQKIIEDLHLQQEALCIKEYPYTSKKNGHTLILVESLVKNPPPIVGDHAFDKETYQKALENNFKQFRWDRLL